MMATTSNAPANDDFHKLLLVVKDLAQRLDENRQATTKLKLHADLLKEHLRVCKNADGDIIPDSPSKAMDELLNERDELVRENTSLRQENQELSELLKDYEKGLETTTSLIRDQAYQASLRTTQIHQEYNIKLQSERMENEKLQQDVHEAEARLIKVSGLLRQAYSVDHEADKDIDQALLDLQTQNRGLRQALGLPVDAGVELEKDLIFMAYDDRSGEAKEGEGT